MAAECFDLTTPQSLGVPNLVLPIRTPRLITDGYTAVQVHVD